MHIVLVYRYYNDGIVYYNLTFCTRKSLMTDLGLLKTNRTSITYVIFVRFVYCYFSNCDFFGNCWSRNSMAAFLSASLANSESFMQKNTGLFRLNFS